MNTSFCRRRSLVHRARRSGAFSLIELVIVVVIIAIIGAIAIPKMSRGSVGAGDSALTQDLGVMRSAVDLFNAEHPGAQLTGTSLTQSAIVNALTEYSDVSGNVSATKTTSCIYGPYLRGSALPALPVATNKGFTSITNTAPGASATASCGWYWDGTTFWANDPTADQDATGKSYNTY